MKHINRILLLLPVLIVTMMIISAPAYAQSTEFLNDTSDITVTLNNSYNIIDGVKEGDLTLTKSGGGTAKAHVVLVKANAKAKFKAITPDYYTSGSTAASRKTIAEAWSNSSWSVMSLSKMAAQYESASDTQAGSVIAAVNGDFGISTANGVVPRGALILEGNKEMVHSSAAEDEFFFGYKDNGVLSIVQRTTSQKGNFSDALCGSAFILRNGDLFGVDGETESRARTGVAYKTNGDVLLISVDEGSESTGITVKQLAGLMKASGCWNGINMDGGGSTTMLTKRSGQALSRKTFEIADTYSDKDPDTGERKIPTGLLLVADNSSVANNVNAVNSVSTDKDSYYAGESIKVTASTDSDGAWVSLHKYEENGTFNINSMSYFWYYAYGASDAGTWSWENGATYDICKDGECNKKDGVISSRGLPPGNYKVSLAQYVDPFDHGKGYKLLAGKDITIEEDSGLPANYSITTDKDAYEVGEPIMVTATASAADSTAWVGVAENGVPLDSDHSAYYWYYVEGSNGGSNHYNGETYNLYEQEQNSNGNVNSALIDKTRHTLLSGTFDISVYDNDSHHIAEDESGNKVTKTITIYDSNKDYEISYRNNDKTIEGLTPATYRYSAGSAVTLPSKAEVEAAVEGYDFYGWFTNSSFTGDAVTEIPKGSVGDRTFYAKLGPKTYTVAFDTDGGTEIAPQTVASGDYAVEPEDPEKEEMIFLGWTTTKGGTEAFDFNVPITGDTTVYASWGEKGYIITFDTQGGSPVDKQTVKSGGKAIQPDNPTREGYRFMGWVTEAGGSTAFDFSTEITDDTTIYASWRVINYSITYDLDGGAAGEAQDNPTTYNVETPTFTLKAPSKEGYAFAGWMDGEGDIVETIEQGSIGDLVLTAQWSRVASLTTDMDEYVDGQALRVTAYCENPGSWIGLYKEGDVPGSSDLAYYWSWVTDGDGNPVISGEEINLLDPSYKNSDNSKPLEYGTYRIILFDAAGYTELLSKTIIIKENTENPLQGSLEIAGYSRDDKKYNGDSRVENGRTLYEYFYGDDISVRAEVSGLGSEDVWVGVIADKSDMTIGGTPVTDHWYWIKDYNGEDVSLNYMVSNEISEENKLLPFGLNYWAVMVSGSGKVLAAEPFNFRTYNMDWNNVEWGESAKKNIKVDLEWTTKLANGEEQKPSLKISRINGLFGYKKDSSGNLVKITEEVLEQGIDYTVSYPANSVDPGNYTIDVTFPSAQPPGEDDQPANNYFKYLSTNPDNYGLKDGIEYSITPGELTLELVDDKTEFLLREPVYVKASGSSGGLMQAWVGLFRRGEIPGPGIYALRRFYVSAHEGEAINIIDRAFEEGRIEIIGPGEYTIVLFSGNDYDIEKTIDFTIGKAIPENTANITDADLPMDADSSTIYKLTPSKDVFVSFNDTYYIYNISMYQEEEGQLEACSVHDGMDGYQTYLLRKDKEYYFTVERVYDSLGEVHITKADAVKVTFDPNGGSFENGETIEYFIRKDENINYYSPADPSRNGYEFSGWNSKADGTGFSINEYDRITKDITFYAAWNKIVTLTLDPNGGFFRSNMVDPDINDYSRLTEPLTMAATDSGGDGAYFYIWGYIDNYNCIPKHDDRVFKEWNTKQDGSGTSYSNGWEDAGPYKDDTTLYAIWKCKEGDHNYVDCSERVEPTCMSEGKEADQECTICGDIKVGEPIPMTDHDYGEWVITSAPTFTNSGWKQRTCRKCEYTDYSWIPALGTDTVPESAVIITEVDLPLNVPTDTVFTITPSKDVFVVFNDISESGYIEMYREADGELIPLEGNNIMSYGSDRSYYLHKDNDYYFIATKGYGSQESVIITKADPVNVTYDSNGGSFESGETHSIMIPEGSIVYYERYEEPARDGYSFVSWNSKPDGTGFDIYEYDGLTKDITFYAKWGKNVTLTLDPNGGYFKGNRIDQDINDYARSTDPQTRTLTDATGNGVGFYIGDDYGEVSMNLPEKEGYIVKQWNTKPDGSGSAYGDLLEDRWWYIWPVRESTTLYAIWGDKDEEHAYVDCSEKVDPTCTEEGKEPDQKCVICGDIRIGETIPPAGHTFEEWTVVKEETCTERGLRKRVCTVCGYEETEKIAASGHQFAEWEETKPYTCTEGGTAERECKVCGAKETTAFAKRDHIWMKRPVIDKEPTCTEKGSESVHCALCDAQKPGSEVEIDKIDHSWDAGKTTTDPTCTKKGVRTYTCIDCGETKTEDVAETGHKLVRTAAKEATAATEGNSEYWTCSVCGKYFSDSEGSKEIQKEDTIIDKLPDETKPADSGETKPSGSGETKPADSDEAKPADSGETKPADSDDQQSADQAKEMGADGTPVGKGASEAAAEKAITNLTNDNDPKGAAFAPLMLKSTKRTNTSIKLTWKKVSGATKYVIYGNVCGKNNRFRRLAATGNNSFKVTKIQKKLKKSTYHKFIVVALDNNNKVVSTSKVIHAATTGKGNPTKVTVSKKIKKGKLSLKKGKSFKLGGKAVGKNVKKHVAVRYESSKPKVASVNKSGKVTAKMKGSCKIYAFAQNGTSITIKLNVK